MKTSKAKMTFDYFDSWIYLSLYYMICPTQQQIVLDLSLRLSLDLVVIGYDFKINKTKNEKDIRMSIFENDVISEREFYESTVKLVCLENTMLPKYTKNRTYKDMNLWEFLRDGKRKDNLLGAIMQGKNALYLIALSKGVKIDVKYKFHNFTYQTHNKGNFYIYQSDYYKTRELMERETEVCELRRDSFSSSSFHKPLRQNVTIIGNITGEDIFGMSFSINNVTLNLVNVLVAKGMNDITWNITDSGNYVPYIFPSK